MAALSYCNLIIKLLIYLKAKVYSLFLIFSVNILKLICFYATVRVVIGLVERPWSTKLRGKPPPISFIRESKYVFAKDSKLFHR